MKNKLVNLMNILEKEFGNSIIYECRENTCIVNFVFLNVNLIVHIYLKDFLRVETVLREPGKSVDISMLPMVKTVMEQEGLRVICDFPLSCIDNITAMKSCISTVIQGLFNLDDNLSKILLNNIMSVVRELSEKGLAGNEIYRILVNQYKVPEDLAETVIESYYAFSDKD